jgi:hypothetical protein
MTPDPLVGPAWLAPQTNVALPLEGTVRVRGTGGAEFDVDVPPLGTIPRERFDEKLAAGELVVVR